MSEGEETVGKVAIGISFGNSYSSIAYTSPDGKVEVIANELGDRQIPSVLSYVDGEELHGTEAKSQLVRHPKNTVAYFRDFIGKDFKSIDPTPCHASAHAVEQGASVAFQINDTEADQQNTVSVTEITTRHLRRLKSSASDYLGKDVTAAVVTVPTNFSEEQRKVVEEAAKAAKLEILQFIHEPTAALLAYDARHTEEAPKDKIIVLADLGGTRSDVAVVASRGGMYTILATVHDYELGGAALDQVLIDYAAKEFIKKHKTDPRQNDRSLAKLKLEAEAVKKSLSIGASASFSIESLADGVDFSLTINRTRYELLANKTFAAITRLIESAIQKADLDSLDVGEIILSGGTSHTPKIAKNLQSTFSQLTTVLSPSTSPTAINPSELAARGAAIQASLIAEFDKEDIEQSAHPVVTVTPHLTKAIGIATVAESVGEEVFQPLILGDTAVPARRVVEIPAPKDGGDVFIKICEGVSEIKVTKPEPKEKAQKDEDDDDSDFSDDEEEDIREKLWKAGAVLAEAAVKGVKKGGKVEVQLSVGADLGLSIIAREVGAKGGVRGVLNAGPVTENGKA
ncbi:heat shock protein-like protein 70 [Myriangium duriaei CBS 260.36]|uniref:Heat shock protein-like protein 70 n=1 Tax=Myriangium duriaei CBS 260.36 TaxID=1168546 RepID=A0A9P4IYE9_9PEZI|nr:heat shock protein-like protein 70 [Myriangium duriaei CBS 260.36]